VSLDLVVICVYLIGITLIGLSAAKKVTTSASFFISDRRFGKAMMTFFTFGAGTNTDQAVTVASKTYGVGASGIWYQWLWLPATPFYWLLAPLFRRMRAVTTSDFLFVRYGQSVAVLFAVVGMAQLSVNIGVVLKATSAMITPVSGGAISSAERSHPNGYSARCSDGGALFLDPTFRSECGRRCRRAESDHRGSDDI
jgi:Na+/proline symporter